VAQKGSIRLRVNLTGRMAHGAMPDEGANPVAALGEILHACRLLEHEIQSRNQPHALLGRFHLTPTVALAGEPEQGNVIPAVASLFLDVRTAPPLVHPDLIARIEATITAAAGAIPGVAARVEVLDDRPATETDTLHPIVRAAVAAHVAETGQPPPFGGVPGSTDGTIFWAANRLPLVTWGPGATTLPHQADECVDLDDVVRYARMYVSAALRYFEMMERS
jgi:succinyl-diaminopimelate desuccinylase